MLNNRIVFKPLTSEWIEKSLFVSSHQLFLEYVDLIPVRLKEYFQVLLWDSF